MCDRERYLLALVRYIHLNPVRAKLVQQPEAYKHSGHAVCLGGQATEVLNPDPVLGLLGGRGAYTLVRRLGFPLREVAAYLGRDAATVSSLLSRLADRMQADPAIRKEVDRFAKIV